MAKSRKKTAKPARKSRPARAKSAKVSRRTTASRTKKKAKPPRKSPQRTRRSKPAAPAKRDTSTMQSVLDTAKEALEMRDRMTARGPLGEG